MTSKSSFKIHICNKQVPESQPIRRRNDLVFPPEIFTWVGICLFVVLSLVIHHYLSDHLATLLPCMYQLMALGGLVQMCLTNFLFQTSIEARNVISLVYFIIAMTTALFTVLTLQKKHPLLVGVHEE